MGKSSSKYVTSLVSLVDIGIMIVYISVFDLSHEYMFKRLCGFIGGTPS